jgi:hypothetical protein
MDDMDRAANDDRADVRDFQITIRPGALSGYGVWWGEVFVSGFDTAPELAHWIETTLRPLDVPLGEAEPMPAMLQSGRDSRRTGQSRIMKLLRGGRS